MHRKSFISKPFYIFLSHNIANQPGRCPGTCRETTRNEIARTYGEKEGIFGFQKTTARRSCVAVRVRKTVFDSGSVDDFKDLLIRTVRGPLKILETNLWGGVRNANNFTVPESFLKMFHAFLCFSDKNFT